MVEMATTMSPHPPAGTTGWGNVWPCQMCPVWSPSPRPGCRRGPPPAVPKGFAGPKGQSWDSLFLGEQKPVSLGGLLGRGGSGGGRSPRMDAQTWTGRFWGLVLSPRLLWRMSLPSGQWSRIPGHSIPAPGSPVLIAHVGQTSRAVCLPGRESWGVGLAAPPSAGSWTQRQGVQTGGSGGSPQDWGAPGLLEMPPSPTHGCRSCPGLCPQPPGFI